VEEDLEVPVVQPATGRIAVVAAVVDKTLRHSLFIRRIQNPLTEVNHGPGIAPGPFLSERTATLAKNTYRFEAEGLRSGVVPGLWTVTGARNATVQMDCWPGELFPERK
jgi:hypothetical protein